VQPASATTAASDTTPARDPAIDVALLIIHRLREMGSPAVGAGTRRIMQAACPPLAVDARLRQR
jgi:hypothetical protein